MKKIIEESGMLILMDEYRYSLEGKSVEEQIKLKDEFIQKYRAKLKAHIKYDFYDRSKTTLYNKIERLMMMDLGLLLCLRNWNFGLWGQVRNPNKSMICIGIFSMNVCN